MVVVQILLLGYEGLLLISSGVNCSSLATIRKELQPLLGVLKLNLRVDFNLTALVGRLRRLFRGCFISVKLFENLDVQLAILALLGLEIRE